MGLLVPEKLDDAQIERIISQKREWILANTVPYALIVFGSAARREMTVASDIDLALIFSDEESLNLGRENLYRNYGEGGTSWAQDLLFYTVDEFRMRVKRGGVCQLIASEGRVLSGRMP